MLCGCNNERLQVNHKFPMPAKVGPKRDVIETPAGWYFDSDAAACGTSKRREHDVVVLVRVVASPTGRANARVKHNRRSETGRHTREGGYLPVRCGLSSLQAKRTNPWLREMKEWIASLCSQ
jgi:hypothetical protein